MPTPLTLRALEHHAYTYRRTWRGTVVSGLLNPVLFLTAMGVGLGSLVDARGAQPGIGGAGYLTFLAPGLLAATAMQTAAGESTYPVMGAIRWERTYDAMLATPLRVVDVLAGQLLWIAVRLTLVSATFLAVTAAFGVSRSWGAVLALPAAVLTGMAFAAPIVAFAATQDSDELFAAIFRFGVVPLFLFSGTFFPVAQLPVVLQPVAYATPLWHGVDLCRSLVLGTATPLPALGHVGYLGALVAAGVAAGRLTYRRRLTP